MKTHYPEGEWVLVAVLDWLRSYRQHAHPRIHAIQQQELQQAVRAGMRAINIVKSMDEA